MWNEANNAQEWTGTMAQLVRMSKDAYTIIKATDPTALVSSPTPAGGLISALSDTKKKNLLRFVPGYAWLSSFLAAGGTPYVDVITFHGYLDPYQPRPAEDEIKLVNGFNRVASQYGLSAKPLWDTQDSWARNIILPDPDMEAAFLARLYLVEWANGVSRLYWYQYGASNYGTIWTATGGLNPAGLAYVQIYNWLFGATMTTPCSATGSVWTCVLTRSGGFQAEPVWDASQTCSNGVCTTSSYTPDAIYIKYVDLQGNVTSITPGSPVQIGAKPILLENQ
jgi:hypothetical protein